ncbi:MAG: hypothetical protein LBC68_13660 [Prevotellaceae bacterium]|jgi:hypothetical protein|nr:hypothetical protein [Prevotellaceae bacterium]
MSEKIEMTSSTVALSVMLAVVVFIFIWFVSSINIKQSSYEQGYRDGWTKCEQGISEKLKEYDEIRMNTIDLMREYRNSNKK